MKKQPAEFQQLTRDSETAAQELEQALASSKDAPEASHAQAAKAFDRITKNCAACHRTFRDVPLKEKQPKG